MNFEHLFGAEAAQQAQEAAPVDTPITDYKPISLKRKRKPAKQIKLFENDIDFKDDGAALPLESNAPPRRKKTKAKTEAQLEVYDAACRTENIDEALDEYEERLSHEEKPADGGSGPGAAGSSGGSVGGDKTKDGRAEAAADDSARGAQVAGDYATEILLLDAAILRLRETKNKLWWCAKGDISAEERLFWAALIYLAKSQHPFGA